MKQLLLLTLLIICSVVILKFYIRQTSKSTEESKENSKS